MAAHSGSVEDSHAFGHDSLMPQDGGSLNAAASKLLRRGWDQALDLPILPQGRSGGCVVVEVHTMCLASLSSKVQSRAAEWDACRCAPPAFPRTRAVFDYDEVSCGLPVKPGRGPSDSSRGRECRRLAFGIHVIIYSVNHDHQSTDRGARTVAKVEIYTSPFCGFCFRAKELLQAKGIDFEEIDVFSVASARDQMMERSGGKTSVPQVFADDAYVGDCDGIHMLDAQGKLDAKLGLTAA